MSFWGKQDEEGIAIFLGQSAQFLGPKCPERGEPRRDVEGQASQVYSLKVCLLLTADFNLGIVESGALCSEQAKNEKPAPERAKNRHRAATWDSHRRNEIISSLRNRTRACNRINAKCCRFPPLDPRNGRILPRLFRNMQHYSRQALQGHEQGASQWPENSLTRRETAST